MADSAGRDALLVRPSRAAAAAMASGFSANPSAIVITAAPSWATSSVPRRPTRSASTPPSTAPPAPPRP